MLAGRRILLIVTGGIAAYKCLELIRRLKERGADVRCVLTKGGEQFVTPLSLAALSGNKVHQDTFSLTDETEMGHIRLSREADLVLVAPATANIIGKMAAGIADNLATTLLMATDKPVMIAPAMNVRMYEHAATTANLATLTARGIITVGPNEGEMACNEFGPGRMSEPDELLAAIESFFDQSATLKGKRLLVTSGPTHESVDPVRYIANRSSGKQGHAIAEALAGLGADVTLVSGPVTLADPKGVRVVKVESARDMLKACEAALPVDGAVCAAAVADWRVDNEAAQKLKKEDGAPAPTLSFAQNPDILKTLSQSKDKRPTLVVGFAAETEKVLEHAMQKRNRKGCDWILANDVSPQSGTFGGDRNTVHLVSAGGVENWPEMSKVEVAKELAKRIAAVLGGDAT